MRPSTRTSAGAWTTREPGQHVLRTPCEATGAAIIVVAGGCAPALGPNTATRRVTAGAGSTAGLSVEVFVTIIVVSVFVLCAAADARSPTSVARRANEGPADDAGAKSGTKG